MIKNSNFPLFNYNDKLITKEDILQFIKENIYNENICCEVDFLKIGYLSCFNKNILFKSLCDIFNELSNNHLTFSFPSFTYSWGSDVKNKEFDINLTKTKLSIFYEYFRNLKFTCRTKDPMFSICSIGDNANKLSKIENTSFGQKSYYHNLHLNNGTIMFLGMTESNGKEKFDPTFFHYVEEFFNDNYKPINYRKHFLLKGSFLDGDKKIKSNFRCFLRNINEYSNLSSNHDNFFNDLKKKSLVDIKKIGNAYMYVSDCKSIFETIINGMKNDIFYLTKYK